jgi:two-component system, OmpR family, phosphate regulon sensor histidine kinase PhoR
MTPKRVLLGIAGISLVLTLMASIFAATFLITDFIYAKLGQHPAPLLAQMINSMLGFLLCFLTLFVFSRFFNPEMNAFEPIIEALEKIAKGNFNVNLDKYARFDGILGELTKSVNNMALELNKTETMRQEFISNVSHEIQSPLTSIRGFAQALQNDRISPQERNHYLGIIEIESTRLSRITENLLKLASLEAAQVKFEPKTYRLDKQIRDIVLACEPQWAAKEIELDLALAEIDIKGDEDLLSQVWVNLIHNSLKFTPPGGKIRLDLLRQDPEIAFKLKDSGIGISAEEQAHIFERFYKADKARTQSHGGSGLGLSIAWKIVEMHQGAISVDSAPGAGTTFTVVLPQEL